MNAAIEIMPVKALFTEALRESFDDLDIPDKDAPTFSYGLPRPPRCCRPA